MCTHREPSSPAAVLAAWKKADALRAPASGPSALPIAEPPAFVEISVEDSDQLSVEQHWYRLCYAHGELHDG